MSHEDELADVQRKIRLWREDRTRGWKAANYTKAEADWIDGLRAREKELLAAIRNRR